MRIVAPAACFGYAGDVARTSAGPALLSPGIRVMGAAVAALLASFALADCGGGTPASSSEDLPPSAAAPPGTVLTFLSGETGAPVASARVTVAGRTHTTNADGQIILAEGAPPQASVEVEADGYLPRRTTTRDDGRFTLWPAASLTGLDAEYSGWLVYTSSTSHDAPHGAQALQRLPASARQAFVLPSEDIRRDALAWAAHEDAVRMLNDALGDRVAYTLVAQRPSGVVFETKLDPRNDHCKDRVRAVTMTSLRGDEITGGTVVFCTLEAARSFTVAHELGHTFGLRHSQHGAEIMYGWFVPHDPGGFSPRETLAMSLMLQREPGNRFPDTDRSATASAARRREVTVCR